MTREADLELVFPWIRWREPVTVTSNGVSAPVCRFCIALDGIRGSDIPRWAKIDFRAHLRQVHGIIET